MTDPAAGQGREGVHRLPVRVYYEDTDAQGVVFYANYLNYLERGRTELLRTLGAAPAQVAQDQGRVFMVSHLDLKYHKSATLDDVLEVQTRVAHLGRVQLTMVQQIHRVSDLITTATVRLAILDFAGRPARLDPRLHRALAERVAVAS